MPTSNAQPQPSSANPEHDDFERRIAQHLRERHPGAIASLADITLQRRIKISLARARAHGLTWQSSLAGFTVLMFEVGPEFDQHPAFACALEMQIADENERIRAIYDHTTDADWEVARASADPRAWNAPPRVGTRPRYRVPRTQGEQAIRPYPHHPDAEIIQEAADHLQPRFVPFESMTPTMLEGRAPSFWTSNAHAAIDLARFGYALGESEETIRWYLEESNTGFAEGIRRGAPFSIVNVLDQLHVALVRGDMAMARKLFTLPAQRCVAEGVAPPDTAWREYEILAALLADQHEDAAARLEQAQAALGTEPTPGVPKAEWTSALSMLDATRRGDSPALAKAVADRLAAVTYRFTSPVNVHRPAGLLDLHGLAIASIARRAGLEMPQDNVYIPLSLLAD